MATCRSCRLFNCPTFRQLDSSTVPLFVWLSVRLFHVFCSHKNICSVAFALLMDNVWCAQAPHSSSVAEWVTEWVRAVARSLCTQPPHSDAASGQKWVSKTRYETRISNTNQKQRHEEGGVGTGAGTGTGTETETETETNQKVSHLSTGDFVCPFAVWVPPLVHSKLYINVKYTNNKICYLHAFEKRKFRAFTGRMKRDFNSI